MSAVNAATGRVGPLLVAAGLAQFIITADWWSVAVALPPMAENLHVRTIDLQWVITGYILTFCAVLGVAGPLGDRYGRKRLLLVGIILFAAVSVWVALSTSAEMVITARVVQGLGGGLIFPLATAVISHASAAGHLARNIAMLTGVAMFGAAAGPVLGGFLTEYFTWRWIFFINVPVCAVAFIMVAIFARESRDERAEGHLDLGGIVLLLAGLSVLSIGIDRIPHWPIGGWLSMTVGGLVLMVLFVFMEGRMTSPIVDVRLFRSRRFVGFCLAGLLGNTAWCILVFGTTLQLQQVLGYRVLPAGLFFLFLSGAVAVASFLAPALERRSSAFTLLWIGLLAQFIGLIMVFIIDDQMWLAIGLTISGVGCAWSWAMPQAGGIQELPREKVGLASGSIMTVMVMSGNTGIVIAAMIIDLYSHSVRGETAGIQSSFLLAAILAGLGLVATVTLLRSSPNATQT